MGGCDFGRDLGYLPAATGFNRQTGRGRLEHDEIFAFDRFRDRAEFRSRRDCGGARNHQGEQRNPVLPNMLRFHLVLSE
jgi:hypothetical protein